MKLIVGTDSTWSLRTWMCAQLANIDFEIQVVHLGKPGYREVLKEYSNTGLVPVLINNDLEIHDSLAITEYFNELSEGALFPKQRHERALARSLCSEMHAGFSHLRAACPFSLDALPPLQSINDNLSQELKRVESILGAAKTPFMFESASAVDAFYAILAFRLNSYGVTFSGKAGAYQQHLLEWPLLKQAIAAAKVWKEE